MKLRDVVTCFLWHQGRILVLRRSQRVGSHRGRWAGVSGSIEGAATPYQQALREIREETGLAPEDVRLLRQGEPLEVPDPENNVLWRVHPFLFQIEDPAGVRLDWEHVASRWIEPGELDCLDTVPMLRETWQRVAGDPQT